MTDNNHDFEAGLREGRLASLEAIVRELTQDVKELKRAQWILIGALAALQAFPLIRDAIQSQGGP